MSVALVPAVGEPPLHDARYGAWGSARIGGGGYVMNLLPTSDPSVYYVYTDVGGFYRSDDGGQNWHMIHAGLPAQDGNQQPRSLLAHAENPDTLLVATGTHWDERRDGIFRSTDGGQTYTQTLEAAFAGNGNERMWGPVLAADPQNPNVVLAAAMKDGVFRSEDFGQTWKNVGLTGINPSDLDFDPAVPGRVLLSAQPYAFYLLGNPEQKLDGGLYESLDSGKNWRRVGNLPYAPYEIAASPTDASGDVTGWLGIFPPGTQIKHSNDGLTWQPFDRGLPTDPQASTHDDTGTITPVSSFAPSTFFALGVAPNGWVLGSGDGVFFRHGWNGRNWSRITPQATAPEAWYGNPGHKPGWVHFGKAISSVVVDPHVPDRWWMTDWYMLWRSDDAGRHWDLAGRGIELTVIHNLAQTPDDPDLVHMGMCDNGYFRSTDAGESFRMVHQVITNNVKDIAVSPMDFDRVYALGPSVAGHWYSSHVFVSDDRGQTWRAAAMGNQRDADTRRINTLVADPHDRDTLWVAVSGTTGERGGIMRSTDAGDTWQPVNNGLPSDVALFRHDIWNVGSELAVSADGSAVAVSHNTSRVFRFDPAHAQWFELDWTHGQPNAVEADPSRPGRFVMASLGAGLIRSDDGGATWSPTSLTVPTRHLAFDQAVPGRLAAGTLDGVYVSTDAGNTWRRLDPSLPSRIGNPVAFAGDRLMVGSSGCGVFWIDLAQ
jgi:photosystem II stability/assembly factor-like uncharacterized protein